MASSETREREAAYFVRQSAASLSKALDEASALGLHVGCVVRTHEPVPYEVLGGGRAKGGGPRTFEVEVVVRKDVT